jgi:hypothetical protein
LEGEGRRGGRGGRKEIVTYGNDCVVLVEHIFLRNHHCYVRHTASVLSVDIRASVKCADIFDRALVTAVLLSSSSSSPASKRFSTLSDT